MAPGLWLFLSDLLYGRAVEIFAAGALGEELPSYSPYAPCATVPSHPDEVGFSGKLHTFKQALASMFKNVTHLQE